MTEVALDDLNKMIEILRSIDHNAAETQTALKRIEDRLSHIENDKLEDIKMGVAPINGKEDRIAQLLGRLVKKAGA